MLAKLSPYLMGGKIIGILILLVSIYFLGSAHGKKAVHAEWDKAKFEQQKEIDKLEDELVIKTAAHTQETGRISSELAQVKEHHAVYVADLKREFDQRLLQSGERAKIYQRLSETGAAECRSLASHAAQLDRSLEEGRSLVKEFGSAITERDGQLRLLGDQILADRKLISN